MPTLTRSTYHHGDLANALMKVAMDRAATGGPQALVLRDLARSVGVTPQAVYRHYPTFDHLLDAVKCRVLAMLGESVEQAAGQATRQDSDENPATLPLRRVRAAVEAYVTFAQNQPGLFSAAFRRTVDLPEAVLVEPLSALLDALVRAGGLDRSRRPGVEFSVWAAAHGMAVLLTEGPLRHAEPAEQEERRRQLVDILLGGLVEG